MKNFKKIITCILAVTALNCMLLTPIGVSAVLKDADTSNNEPFIGYEEYIKYCEENALKDGIIIVKNAGTGDGTYHFGSGNSNLSWIEKVDDNFNTSLFENIIVMDFKNPPENDKEFNYILVETGDAYTHIHFDTVMQEWNIDDVSVQKPNNTTIGESENKPITEITVGDSTFPRGDINLDGKVTTVDLLMLKKYLLGLMEW